MLPVVDFLTLMPHARCCTPFNLVPPFFNGFVPFVRIRTHGEYRGVQGRLQPVGWLGPPQSTGGYPFAFHGPSKRHPTTPQHPTPTRPGLQASRASTTTPPCPPLPATPVCLHAPRPPGALGWHWLGLICLPPPLSWPLCLGSSP